MRRLFLLVVVLTTASPAVAGQAAAPAPVRRPDAPLTMARLDTLRAGGVSAVEVSDYTFGGFEGEMKSPPHADINPRKAFVILWRGFDYRFVFSHEASYCPWFELPSGAGVSYAVRGVGYLAGAV